MPSLAVLVSAVLVSSCGQTDTHIITRRITDANDRYTHATTTVVFVWLLLTVPDTRMNEKQGC